MIETTKLRSLMRELNAALDKERYILAGTLCKEIDEESARIAQECMVRFLDCQESDHAQGEP